ncbi:MAG: SAP domain-containing protein [Nitrospirae bacterium]|nr:SAP domain-containing protein [Nitrospirota bacterium]
MKMLEIREIAKRKGIEAGKLKKTELVRAIQKVEGYSECFATPYGHECNQPHCLWREDCMKGV